MTVEFTEVQRQLLTEVLRTGAFTEERLAALTYHIEWLVNRFAAENTEDEMSGVLSKNDVWTFNTAGPFAPNDDRENRVEALKQALHAARIGVDDGVIPTAEAFLEFLNGGQS